MKVEHFKLNFGLQVLLIYIEAMLCFKKINGNINGRDRVMKVEHFAFPRIVYFGVWSNYFGLNHPFQPYISAEW